jgi:hypothetical protein
MGKRAALVVVAALLGLAVAGAPAFDASNAPPAVGSGEILLAAGDIASCSSTGDEATATLLDSLPGTVLLLGDLAYDSGSTAEFNNCYHPTWGRHKDRSRPSPGNHEYGTPGATGYYGYFGAAAGDPTKGYYSFDIGEWHVIALNSNCGAIGTCEATSPMVQWLRDDLAAHPKMCTLAYWHHPRFSSGGVHGNNTAMGPMWDALYDWGADLVLNGHVHNYERFGPQTPAAVSDPATGIVQFIVGTGGRGFYGFGTIQPNSIVRNADSFGVLQLTLNASGYDFEFKPAAGYTLTDEGSGDCHSNDQDGDIVVDESDNCPTVANGTQVDGDDDGIGDVCESTEYNTDPAIADSDEDGCRDGAELWDAIPQGGWRNPDFEWDFYDVNGTSRIDAVDIALVRANFNANGPVPPEDVIYDRSSGLHTWAPGPPDNKINALDIGLVRASFNHNCQ